LVPFRLLRFLKEHEELTRFTAISSWIKEVSDLVGPGVAVWEKGAYLSYGGSRVYVNDPFSSDPSSSSSYDFTWGVNSSVELVEDRTITPFLNIGKHGKELKEDGKAYADS
jgi:hypothetical protein